MALNTMFTRNLHTLLFVLMVKAMGYHV